ncbi:MAG TPA: hypothetical protein ENH94_08115 [Phycisphaerales bacterium]|nr:hypothetical protein [Phycisphaerales bacterium]
MKCFIVVITISLFIAIVSGSVFHELGHGLTAAAVGGDFSVLGIWPGVQIYPEISFDNMHIFVLGYADIQNVELNWKIGLVHLMGSGTTAIIAYCLVGLVSLCKSKNTAICVLIISVVYAWDIILYSILPQIGLRHWFLIGGKVAEPFLGAQRIGIPNWLYFLCLGLHLLIYHSGFCLMYKKKVAMKKTERNCSVNSKGN